MTLDKHYVSTLEEAIKRDLLPVYLKYYKEKALPVPDLHAYVYQLAESSTSRVPALFKKKGGVLEFTSDRVKARKN